MCVFSPFAKGGRWSSKKPLNHITFLKPFYTHTHCTTTCNSLVFFLITIPSCSFFFHSLQCCVWIMDHGSRAMDRVVFFFFFFFLAANIEKIVLCLRRQKKMPKLAILEEKVCENESDGCCSSDVAEWEQSFGMMVQLNCRIRGS